MVGLQEEQGEEEQGRGQQTGARGGRGRVRQARGRGRGRNPGQAWDGLMCHWGFVGITRSNEN